MKLWMYMTQFLLRRLGTVVFLLLSIIFALLWYQIENRILSSIPTYQYVTKIESLTESTEIILGRNELGQFSGNKAAEKKHIRLFREDRKKPWMVQNIAEERRVLLTYSEFGELYLRRWQLQQDDQIKIAQHIFHVKKAKDGTVQLEIKRKVKQGEQTILYHIEHDQGFSPRVWAEITSSSADSDKKSLNTWLDDNACGLEKNWVDTVKAYLDRKQSSQSKDERTLVTFGGNVDCSNRISIPEISPNALRLRYHHGSIFLAPNEKYDAYKNVLFKHKNDANWQRYQDIARPLFPAPKEAIAQQALGTLESIIIGKTHYAIRKEDWKADNTNQVVSLTPIKNIHRFFKHTQDNDKKNEQNSNNKNTFICVEKNQRNDAVGIHISCNYDLPVRDWLWSKDIVLKSLGMGLFTVVVLLISFSFLRYLRKNVTNNPHNIIEESDNQKMLRYKLWLFFRRFNFILLVMALSLTILFSSSEEVLSQFSRSALGLLLIINWGLVSIAILLTPERNWRLYSFWLLLSIILMLGSLTLELLAQGASDSRWMKYDLKHLRSLSIVFLTSIIALQINMSSWRQLIVTAVHGKGLRATTLRSIPIILLVSVFFFWLVFGREEGLSGFQPMELGKFIALLIFIIVIVNIDYRQRFFDFLVQYKKFILSLISLGLFYAVIFGVIPGAKSDYSPILILVILGLSLLVILGLWLFAQQRVQQYMYRQQHAIAPDGQGGYKLSRRPSVSSIAFIGGVLLFSGAWLTINNYMNDLKPTDLKQQKTSSVQAQRNYNIQPLNVPEQRISVYYDIDINKPNDNEIKHPDLGSQLIRSLNLIAQTEHKLSEIHNWRCLVPFPFLLTWLDEIVPAQCKDITNTGSVQNESSSMTWGYNTRATMSLAAVQDDFVMAFFIYRFGVDYTLVLLLTQLALLWLIIDTALRKYIWQIGDYKDDAVRQVLCFLSIGGVGLLLLHWVIALSNVLGWLPVMGQPMTGISSANSHILFMLTPIIISFLLMMRLLTVQKKTTHYTSPFRYR